MIPWIIGYLGVLCILLVGVIITGDDKGDNFLPILLAFVWPVALPVIVIIVLCYWIARGFRGFWGLLFG